MENLKYPIGRLQLKDVYTPEETNEHIDYLSKFPVILKDLAFTLTEEHLATPYRPEGWTARQVIHHISDSHSQMLTRLKWILTEETPTIKAYHEDLWAKLPDYELPVSVSVSMIDLVHQKVVALVKGIKEEDFKKSYLHPENGKHFSIEKVLALYTWHCKHHLGHLKICKGE